MVDLVVNEPVPIWAIQEVPDALRRLPSLPDAIEYRIVDGSLILWDTHAEILIDALSGAFLPSGSEDAGKSSARPDDAAR